MKPKPIRDSVIALLALIITLAAAYWLDDASFRLIQRSRETFDYRFTLWLPALALLLLVAGLLSLTGWLVTRATCPRTVDVIYVLAGVTAVIMVPAVFALGLSVPLYALLETGPVSFWTVTGAMLAAAGLFHLFRRRRVA
jgi:hypothetical protein